LMQYWMPKHRAVVREALRLANREDLIGQGRKCLVPSEDKARKDKKKRTEGAKK
ncbi:MAG: DUF3362 domain-containing protein, partial [Schwartzia sp.]|nr:DUF3362 domain-containing protein [Schwartzia sp. (in: firmicutes)]